MQWDLVTNVILGASFVVLTFFIILALYQWFIHKSFSKIDPELRWASLPIIMLAVVYYLFDHILILNTRPNGSGEPSFPSTHVMIVATVFALAAIILPKYIKSRKTRLILDLMMLVLIILVSVGRVLANMHWASDVIGALAFAAIFAIIYYLIIRRIRHA